MNINVTIENKTYQVARFTAVHTVLEQTGANLSKDYNKNPIIAVYANGKPVSLRYDLQIDSTLVPIKAHDRDGRRIYRHTLCFVLCYAARLLWPKRQMIIGHSIGDGFYYNFADGSKISPQDVSDLKQTMIQLSGQDKIIHYTALPQLQAVSYFKECGMDDTALLISQCNHPEVPLYQIDTYYDVAYEPLASTTSILTCFELLPYGNGGLLLRYPTSTNPKTILPLHDNPKLFEIFEEYRQWGKILNVRSIGQMNSRILKQSVDSYVRLSEALQRNKLATIASMICTKKAQAVFIAGPSSSGKTTFAVKLCEQLSLLGLSPIRISLDDYYIPRAELPKNEKNEPDYECLESLKLDLFYSDIQNLFNYKEVHLPIWNFAKQQRTYRTKASVLNTNSVLVIEGIHGLNPKITGCVEKAKSFKIYISALTQLNLDSHNRVSTTDNRIIRRIVRDNRTREIDAVTTLSMFEDVERGERKHIFPYQNNADVMFNSALDYELGVLSIDVLPLLKAVSPDAGKAYVTARRLIAFLENIYPISQSLVPSDSILREFIGGSDYRI